MRKLGGAMHEDLCRKTSQVAHEGSRAASAPFIYS